ncbi:cation:proton antiporter domain-containing protein [Sphingomonas nostoxanthinifaciens]|uniref:cation:proton antiporter domain-containing protein n=1 Tax=Sphingomonas nostoxanthinifaciens TaxID=2872652 RepID=UPI001CC1F1FA|nr:cation:proton antiporter [Sphingomonas nostoxanthinifaciens]UAK22882.1 cation:proton antiporter [Sphingomonas nostoxanthinifaciens]
MASAFNPTGFSDALVILGAAGVVIPAFARWRINPVIGFILVGIAVGPAGLGSFVGRAPWLSWVTITNPHAIEPFAELGIVMLLFSIGLELSFRRLWAMRRAVFGLGAAELAGSAILLGMGFWLAGQTIQSAFGLGMALALSSTALVLPIAGTRGPVGERAFAMLLFEDLALVPIIFALGALAPHGGEGGGWQVARTLALGGVTVGVLLVGGRWLLPRLFAQAARTKSPELFLAASLLVVILASLATSAAGLSPIVGALLAGVLIAETDYHGEVELMTAPFKGLALGVFLITVGMSLDLRVVGRFGPALTAAVLTVVAVKTLVTGLLLRVRGAERGVSLETGLLMSAPSETTLIVLGTASAVGMIDRETAAFWQIVTAIGLTITPLLAMAGRRLALGVDRHQAEAVPPVSDDARRALIVGFGRVGRLVAQMFDAHELPYLAVDADADTVRAARKRGYQVIFGDITRPGMIDHLAAGSASAVVLTMDDPVQLVRLTARLRDAHPDLTIVARARDPNHAAQLYRAGATDAVPETIESSLQLSEAALVDLGVAMGPVIASIHEKRAQLRAKIMEMADTGREPPLRRRTIVDDH